MKHEGYNPTAGNNSYQYKYNGKELQTESGMLDYGFRQYMPELGRFGVLDPLAETTFQPYSYASNNPISYIDFLGLKALPPTNSAGYTNGQIWTDGEDWWKRIDGGWKNTKRDETVIDEVTIPHELRALASNPSSIMSVNCTACYNGMGMNPGITLPPPSNIGIPDSFYQPVLHNGSAMMIGGHGDILGLYDIGGQIISTWEPKNQYLAMAVGLFAAVALKRPALAKVDAYAGVKEASAYLQKAGVPRLYRKQIIESFEIGTISLQTAGKSTYGLRFYGGAAKESGRYLFPTFDNLINRKGLALPPSWNSMLGIKQFQVSPGATYIFGRAASQGGIYTGGSYQMYINDLSNLIK